MIHMPVLELNIVLLVICFQLQIKSQLYCTVIVKEWNYTYPNKQYKSYTVAVDNVCNF